jgi:hypothetical protein
MRIVRLLLLLFMGFVVLLMVSCPAIQHTTWTRSAFREFFTAQRADEAGSTEETKRNLEAARLKLEEAKRMDRKQILVIELVMLGILVAAGFGFMRAGRRTVADR